MTDDNPDDKPGEVLAEPAGEPAGELLAEPVDAGPVMVFSTMPHLDERSAMRIVGAYVLDENDHPVACDSLGQWGRFMEDFERRSVARDIPIPGVLVSTLFLGLDMSSLALRTPDGFRILARTPLLWETRIMGGKHDGHEQRYATVGAALAGHRAAVQMVLSSLPS